MNNELVETPALTENDAEDAPNPEIAQPDATDGAEKPAEPAKTAEQLEIERLRRALTKRDRTQGKLHLEREQLAAELEQLRQRQPAQQASDPAESPITREVFEREVLTHAEQIAAGKEFNAKANSVAAAGHKEFTDFDEARDALIEEAGQLVQPTGKFWPNGLPILGPTVLGDLILDSDAPAALIHYLGKNPELAAELDGLTPGRMARKLAVIEAQMTAKPKTSSAPKPLEPLKAAGGAGNDLSDDLSMDEWLRRRNKQLKAR